MNNTNVQLAGEVLVEKPTRLTIQWDEGTSFDVKLQTDAKTNPRWDGDLFEAVDLFKSHRRKCGSYTEFLKHSW